MFEVFEKADTTVSAETIPKGVLYKAAFDPKSYPGASAPFGFFDPFSQSSEAVRHPFIKLTLLYIYCNILYGFHLYL